MRDSFACVTVAASLAIGSLATAQYSTLIDRAVLPAATFRDGPPSGAAIDPNRHPRAAVPFASQPIQGISALVRTNEGEDRYLALSDNGYGARANSADFELCFHRFRIGRPAVDPQNARGRAALVADWRSTILLRDPQRLLPFSIVHDADPQRILTGADLDPESMQLAPDGTLWIGDEFGPFLLHFSAAGELLDPPFSPPHPYDPTRVLRSPDHPELRDGDGTSADLDSSAGFEALAIDPVSPRLLAILEKPTRFDPRRVCLAFEFDMLAKRFTGNRIELPLADESKSIADAQLTSADHLLALERDDREGKAAVWKKVIEFALPAPDRGFPRLLRREVADLLGVTRPAGLQLDSRPEDIGITPTQFAMPFLTIESLLAIDSHRLLIANDNNYPFSAGRHGNGDPDDTEFVEIQTDTRVIPVPASPRSEPITIATFNASLNRPRSGQLLADLMTLEDPQAKQVAEILQTVRPDVVLLNEFDRDPVDPTRTIRFFLEEYVQKSQNGKEPLVYPHWFAPESNTGIGSGVDLDRNGKIGGEGRDHGGDALGYGEFPGQYAFLLLSRFPLDLETVRTFRTLKWKDMPGTILPDDKTTPEPHDWYSPEALDVLPLSSKNHVDITVLGPRPIHLLLSHPTPPAFDGPEDRNGLRNAAEIRFWLDYLTPGQGDWILDDLGRRGGLPESEPRIVLGDLNSDPFDGNSRHDMIRMLLAHARLQDPQPRSEAARAAALAEGFAGSGDPSLHTADFAAPNPGNLRVDYVLPSKEFEIVDSGVFWLKPDDPSAALNAVSDHHLVWVDLRITSRAR